MADYNIEHTQEKKDMVTKLPVGLCCDAVHLNKNMRSMFEKYDLTISKKFVEKYKLSSNKVKFQYILDLMEYEENCEKKWLQD